MMKWSVALAKRDMEEGGALDKVITTNMGQNLCWPHPRSSQTGQMYYPSHVNVTDFLAGFSHNDWGAVNIFLLNEAQSG